MQRTPTIFSDPTGRVLAVNQRKLADIPVFLLSNPPSNVITIPRGQSSLPVQFSAPASGPLTVVSMACSLADPTGSQGANVLRPFKILLSLQDGQTQRMLMNTGIHSSTIFGNGVNPFKFPEVLVLREARALTMVLSDISTSVDDEDTTVRVSMLTASNQIAETLTLAQAQQARLRNREFLQLPMFYGLDQGSVVLAGGSPGTGTEQSITIAETSHFQLMALSAFSTGAFTMQIVDAITGEPLIEQPIGSNPNLVSQWYGLPNAVLFGSANFPFKFHEPRTFRAGTKLRVFLQDISGSDNTVYITLAGRMLTTWLGQ